jgi:hypothetical protein
MGGPPVNGTGGSGTPISVSSSAGVGGIIIIEY